MCGTSALGDTVCGKKLPPEDGMGGTLSETPACRGVPIRPEQARVAIAPPPRSGIPGNGRAADAIAELI